MGNDKSSTLLKSRSIEHFDMDSFMKQIQKECPEEYGKVIVETAGFVPLEVRFKRMQEAGIRAQFTEGDFTSNDWRDIYLNKPEFDVVEGDELEDIVEKQQGRMAYMQQLMREKQGKSVATDEALSNEPSVDKPEENAAENGSSS